MKIFNIVLIGAGQIGSRHLQALTKSKNQIALYVVDPSQASLDLTKERFNEMPKNENVKSITFSISLDILKQTTLDIAIIATTSDIRKKVFLDLLAVSVPKNIILEKVVFQNIDDFKEIERILKNHQITAWINHPRRMWEIYQFVKSEMKLSENLHLNISGSNWGLGSNCIHFIDLFYFLNGNQDIAVSCENLEDELKESKRIGFYDIFGTLQIVAQNKSTMNVTSYVDGNSPLLITICSKNANFIIDESRGKIFYATNENKWQWQERMFNIPYQSGLTNLVVDEIIEQKTCPLPPFDESLKHHYFLFIELNKYFSLKLRKEIKNCPIT